MLDIHRIPCTHDIIELPYREMRAELHSPVEVGAVSYGGRFLTKSQVRVFISLPYLYLFCVSSSLSYLYLSSLSSSLCVSARLLFNVKQCQVEDWLTSEDGRREIRMLSPLHINDATYCKIRGGCECGNVASCNSTTCRAPLQCNDPISSPTMCCSFCGSLITIPVNLEQSYRQLELEFSKILSRQV